MIRGKKYAVVILLAFPLYAIGDEEKQDTVTHFLKEVVVFDQSARNRVNYSNPGSEMLELKKLSITPQLFGETDIIKSISLLPGVRSETDGAGGFEVRGGNPYQNLVTMDGMTLYNPSHLMGIFSTFNDDAIRAATLHKGPIPVNIGNVSSSALETYMKIGDMRNYNFSGTIGILNAKIAVGGPIIKDKLSFSFAARRSYMDLFLGIVPQYKGTIMNFYDVNSKIRYNIDNRNLFDISFIMARDNLAISNLMEMHWGNTAGSLNWISRTDRCAITTTFSVTNYTTDMGTDIMDANQSLKEFIRNVSINEGLRYSIAENHNVSIGFRTELLMVKSGDMTVREFKETERRSGLLNALWFGYEGQIKFVRFNAGSRFSLFSSISSPRFHAFEAFEEEIPDFSHRDYFNIEPRLGASVELNDNNTIKFGVSVTTQAIHGLRSSTTTFPFDRYALASAYVKPETSTIYSVGYAGMTPKGSWDWSIECYYKSMGNIYDYKDGVTMFSRIGLESLILPGEGRSYGLELIIRKNIGKLNGWISYTLSKAQTKIHGINDGRWYNASNDRRNDIAIVGIYNFNRYWTLSGSWTYSSGRPITAPDGKYEIDGKTCYYFTQRNSYKTSPSHRLDFSASYTSFGKRITSILSFGVFNVYCHYSPFVVYFEDDTQKPSGTKVVQQSLLPIVPSLSYTIKF